MEVKAADFCFDGRTGVCRVPLEKAHTDDLARENITVTASVEFKEVATGKVIWANPSFQFRDEYQKTTGATGTDPTANLTQDRDAQERIAKAVARSVVTSVFEAF